MMSIESVSINPTEKTERDYAWARNIRNIFFYELLLVGIPAHYLPILALSIGGLVVSEFNEIHKQNIHNKEKYRTPV